MTVLSPPTQMLPAAPAWVGRWVMPGRRLPIERQPTDRFHLSGQIVLGSRFTVVHVRVAGARHLSDTQLRRATRQVYDRIRRGIATGPAPHPVRFWNFVPGIVDPAGDGLDRYMVFNAGRYDAFVDWFGGDDAEAFARRIATASAVGHDGDNLIVYCLADAEPGRPIENPRQRPAYHYSSSYGPLPPCFARATRIAAGPDAASPTGGRVLVAGTSAVRGEDSVCVGDVSGQLDEMFVNLEVLLREAGAEGVGALRHVRLYHTGRRDPRRLHAEVLRRLPRCRGRIELMQAPLCRRDLEVELEGVADVD